MREVERVFQSINLIRECCDRHVAALIGKFPLWYLKGEDGERVDTAGNDRAAQAEIQLQRWLDAVLARSDAGVTDQSDPFVQSVTNLAVCGYGALRLWQPKRFEDSDDPIERIHLHAPAVGSVEEERGEDGFLDKLTYRYGNAQSEVLELDGSTLVITGTEIDGELRIDTGGRWAIAQMRCPSLLTPQIKQNQNALNHAATMLMRNQEQGGFLQRIFLNAQMPGEWVEDATAPGGQRFVPSAEGLRTGPGEDSFIYGLPQPNAAGGETYSTPTVSYRDPVGVSTFLESVAAFRSWIYHQFGQGHLLADGDGSLSGVSRIQLRQDFEVALTRQKRVIEAAIAQILNVVLRLLDYPDLEVVVQLRISTGKLSPEERAAVLLELERGLLSKSTAMSLLGSVDDVDAELELIRAELEAELAVRPAPIDNGGGDPPTPPQPGPQPTDDEE